MSQHCLRTDEQVQVRNHFNDLIFMCFLLSVLAGFFAMMIEDIDKQRIHGTYLRQLNLLVKSKHDKDLSEENEVIARWKENTEDLRRRDTTISEEFLQKNNQYLKVSKRHLYLKASSSVQ